MDDLTERLPSLPPEIVNEILKLALTVNLIDLYVDVDHTWKPPSWLHVSRYTRETYARRYYSQTIFRVRSELFSRWWHSRPSEHANLITKVCIQGPLIHAHGMNVGELAQSLFVASICLFRRVSQYPSLLEFEVDFGLGPWIKIEWLCWDDIRAYAEIDPWEGAWQCCTLRLFPERLGRYESQILGNR